MSTVQSCPDPLCGDRGFSVHPDNDGEPEQVQCEFCYTNPQSLFNLRKNENEDSYECAMCGGKFKAVESKPHVVSHLGDEVCADCYEPRRGRDA